jgi:hypothetical protein
MTTNIDPLKIDIICPYCLLIAVLTTGAEIYVNSPDLAKKYFYRCAPCDAYVGCHPDSVRPLGRLANKELRWWKMEAHRAFDPKWVRKIHKVGKGKARRNAYKWLAGKLDMDVKDCHIGRMDIEMCKKVVEVCRG